MAEDNYSKYRGKCKEYCEELCAKDPSLRLVRGWYDDILWGRQMHWWCVDANGVIIDPTVKQFSSQHGEYIECDILPDLKDGASVYTQYFNC